MSNITAQDFKDWLQQPETVLFMEYVDTLRFDNDKLTHDALKKNALEQAALFNAGMTQLKEVLKVVPETIIDDLEENENERKD